MDKIVIAGGSGFLGRCLVDYYKGRKELVILSRKETKISGARVVVWDGRCQGEWASEFEGAKVVINLSGKSVDCRYTERNRALIYSSRIDSTQAIGKAIHNCQKPPQVWINSSSATIYRHSLYKPMDEEFDELGSGFSVDVCQKWEEVFNSFELPNTRKIIARIAIVLGRNGGALQPLQRLAKFGLGGHQGPGNQMVSWLHQDDFTAMMDYLINNSHSGIFNLAAPNPVTNRVFMKAVRQAAGIKIGIPSPSWLLEIGARIIQTETELILKSRYVVPRKLEELGYNFSFSAIDIALNDLLSTQDPNRYELS
ncbi:MAG: TIGR01777 family oxidoreductase [Fulvivirga sp.]